MGEKVNIKFPDLVGKEIDNIMVSIIILTYYHENYIKQAIASVLSQITDYKYEIIISDDGSKDNTVKILKEYETRYPNIIKLIIHGDNIGLTRNQFEARCAARGKYIVTLSGDDYWIDNYKLQKQVEFLENHPSYLGVATVVEMRYDNEVTGVRQYPDKKFRGKDFVLENFLKNHNFPTHGMMIHNLYLTDAGRDYMGLIKRFSNYIDDLSECILVLRISPIFILDFCTYAYRVNRNKEGKKNFNSINTFYTSYQKHIELLNSLFRYFGNISLRRRYSRLVAKAYLHGLWDKKLPYIYELNKSIPLGAKIPYSLYCIEVISSILINFTIWFSIKTKRVVMSVIGENCK